ncbi:hypothetical protein CEXT_534601 [Caerostris extrusa]|uniref:LAGLIDADG homing endonuclease n=1 Tax=Caerostris extrusa TaxID=172846 RepID=A0AAV4Y5B9_CAEEX|nr:hypothetical protein CEXT_534601 [Caerostris extrusa]
MNDEVTEPSGRNISSEGKSINLCAVFCHQNIFSPFFPRGCLLYCLLARHLLPYALRHNAVPCLIRYLYRKTFYVLTSGKTVFCMVEEQIAYGQRKKWCRNTFTQGTQSGKERNNCHDLLSIISWKRGTKIGLRSWITNKETKKYLFLMNKEFCGPRKENRFFEMRLLFHVKGSALSAVDILMECYYFCYQIESVMLAIN